MLISIAIHKKSQFVLERAIIDLVISVIKVIRYKWFVKVKHKAVVWRSTKQKVRSFSLSNTA